MIGELASRGWAVYFAMLVAFSLVGLAAPAAGTEDMRARVRSLCQATCDMPDECALIERRMADTGEEGRAELLELAQSGSMPLVNCALSYLTAYDDRHVLPIARAILIDQTAPSSLLERALHAVGQFKDEGSFERTLEIFRSGPEDLRASAAAALGAFGKEEGLAALREALAGPTWGVAVGPSGVAGNEAAVEPLLALRDEPAVKKWPFLQSQLALSLARIGSPESRTGAMSLLGSVEDRGVRSRLIGELFEIMHKQRYVRIKDAHGNAIRLRRRDADPGELSDIDEHLRSLQNDPDAPVWVRNQSFAETG